LKAAPLRCQKELNISDEQIKSGREFHIVGQLHGKSKNKKMRLVRLWGMFKRLKEKDDLITPEGW